MRILRDNYKYDYEKAGEFLVPDNELSVEEMVKAIVKRYMRESSALIDYVEGVTVWEKVEFEFTCEQFLEHITVKVNPILDNMKLAIDEESVNIYVDFEDEEPLHVVYWHIDEVAEDENVAISIANAIDLFHTNKQELLDRLGIVVKES